MPLSQRVSKRPIWLGDAARPEPAADDPSHRWIMAQAFGVVDVLDIQQAARTRTAATTRPMHADHSCRACVGEHIARHQTEGVVEFAISKQASIGGDHGAAKLERQAAVEIEPNSIGSRFTRWVRHGGLARSRISC